MRALIMGDAHIGKSIRGRSRIEEQRRILASFTGAVDDYEPDVIVLPGDTFDSSRPGPDEITAFAQLLGGLIERERPVLITPGNHDGPTVLRSLEGKVTTWLGALPLRGVHALSDPSFIELAGAGFYVLPYPHKRSLDHLLDRSLRDRTEEVSRALENIIETEHERLRREHPGLPLIFVGHLSVLNAQLSADQAMRLGWDVTIRREVLDPFDASFLGHIHRQQEVIGGHSWYSGSPLYGDFGETTQSKGFLLWDSAVPAEGWPTSSGSPPVPLLPRFTSIRSDHLPMHRFDVYESKGWEIDDWPGTEGYVQVRMFPDQGGVPSWAVKRAVKAQFDSAAGVWLDVMPKPASARTRLEASVRASEPDDVLRSYLRLNGIPEDPVLEVAHSIMAAVDGQ